MIERNRQDCPIERSHAISLYQWCELEVHSREGPVVGWILGAPNSERQAMSEEINWQDNLIVRRAKHTAY